MLTLLVQGHTFLFESILSGNCFITARLLSYGADQSMNVRTCSHQLPIMTYLGLRL